MPKTEELDVKAIVIDRQFQPRAEGLDADHVKELKEAYAMGQDIPPPRVYRIAGRGDVLTQGFHRLEALLQSNTKTVACEVREGTVGDAVCDAAGSNVGHGLKRTNADKRRSVEMVLAACPELSSRIVAERAGVNHEMVSKLRNQLADSANCPPPKRVGKDGKQYQTTKPTKKQPEPVKQVTENKDDKATPVRMDKGTAKVPDGFEAEHEPEDAADDLIEDSWTPVQPKETPKSEMDTPGKWYVRKDHIDDVPGVYRPRFSRGPGGETAIDAYGTPVPDGVGDYFGDHRLRQMIVDAKLGAELMDKVWNTFSTFKRELNYPWAKHADGQELAKKMRNLAVEFVQFLIGGVPYAVCPTCHGKKCKECRFCGYWPREEAEAQRSRFPKSKE